MSAPRSAWARHGRGDRFKVRPDHEPSVWLRTALDRRVREAVLRPEVMAAVAELFHSGGGTVALTLTDQPSDPKTRARWEFTCDRCGTWVPEGDRGDCKQITPVITIPPIDFAIGVWLCADCARREVIDDA